MSDETNGEEAPLDDAQISVGIELVREELMREGGAMAFAAKLNEGVLEGSGLDPKTFFLVRIAAAAALGAPKVSWDFNLEMAEEMGMDADDILGVQVAITPTIGTVRFLQAVEHIIEE